jgi:hypothetical protein
MKKQFPKYFVLLTLAVIVLSQVTCEYTVGKDKPKPLTDEEISIISQINNSDFIVSNIDVTIPSNCGEYEPPANQFNNFIFDDDRLIVSDNSNDKRYYERDYKGNYCRRLDSGVNECFLELSKNTFVFSIQILGDSDYCYQATYNFNLTNPPAIEESGSNQEEASQSSNNCNATHLLDIENGEWIMTETEDGTPYCEYQVIIKNSSENEAIWVVYFLHETDGYQNTERTAWFSLNMFGYFEPGQSFVWEGSVWNTYLVDADFSGPSIYIMEKIAAYYDTEECRQIQHKDVKTEDKEAFFQDIAITVQSSCPYE